MTTNAYIAAKKRLFAERKNWLVTGVAGFIGSNLLETLLKHDQCVVGLDNFSTGRQSNLDHVKSLVTREQWSRFVFAEGDICVEGDCLNACNGVNFVLHQAALGSVPRSIKDPLTTNRTNINGFVNMLVAAQQARVARFVYASSSAVYGDHPELPKVEERTGALLSPYAVTKAANEMYADVFARNYGMELIGLRYFNVFGRRQSPDGEYAAVIPRWISAMLNEVPVYINGDGETSRDFCYIDNVVQANVLASLTHHSSEHGHIYNVAAGSRTTLNQLYENLTNSIRKVCPHIREIAPIYQDFRSGDVRHSLADVSKIRLSLGYCPTHNVSEGLGEALDWYIKP